MWVSLEKNFSEYDDDGLNSYPDSILIKNPLFGIFSLLKLPTISVTSIFVSFVLFMVNDWDPSNKVYQVEPPGLSSWNEAVVSAVKLEVRQSLVLSLCIQVQSVVTDGSYKNLPVPTSQDWETGLTNNV